MKFAQIRKYDIANGEGIRCSIFVSGCTHRCKNCFNEEYQDFNYGNNWTDDETQLIIEYLKDDNISGLTLLGGEPMQNLYLIDVIRKVKKEVNKNIWIYSGYTYDQIINDNKKLELLKECDVLVDGLFVEELLDLKLKFRGSSNQRIIDIKKSLEKNEIIEYKLK